MSAVPADDRGLLLGDGLFETVLFDRGRAVLWEAHVARLMRGCAVLGYPAPDAAVLAERADAAIRTAGLGDARAAVRLTWTAGSGGRGLERPPTLIPRLLVSAAAASERLRAPAVLITATVRRNAGSPASRLKTLSYLDNVLARREAVAAGADEALMLNAQGELACASAANLFLIADNQVWTPALACGVLDGIMRTQALAAAAALGAPVRETHARASQLLGAQAIFLTNSLIGVRPVRVLDGRPLGDHPLMAALDQALTAFA